MERAQLDEIVTKAGVAQREWSRKAIQQRVEVTEEFLNRLEESSLKLAVMITDTMGKPITQSQREIETVSVLVSSGVDLRGSAASQARPVDEGRLLTPLGQP